MKIFIRSLVLGVSLCIAVTSAWASGIHYQVSTSTRFLADEAANLTGLQMNWVYDPEVSAIIVEGRELGNGGLRQLGEDMMADLYTLGYYVQLTANGQPVPIRKVEQFTIKLTEDSSIQLGLQVDLQQRVPTADKVFRLKLVDADGSASLLYAGVDRVVLDNALVAKCAVPVLDSAKMNLNSHEMDVQTVSVSCQ